MVLELACLHLPSMALYILEKVILEAAVGFFLQKGVSKFMDEKDDVELVIRLLTELNNIFQMLLVVREEDQDSIWNGVLSGVALSQGAANLANDFERAYGKWNIFGSPLGESSSLEPCNFGNVTKCGLPTVSFFGGDGIGGAGNALLGGIIDNVDTEDAVGDVLKIGSIVGVELTDPGVGYTEAPIVTFQDSCNKGYGAYGRAIIDQVPTSPTFGQITSVVMISEGVNYPAEIDELPLFIEQIIVEDGGSGYADSDADFDVHDDDAHFRSARACS